MRRWLRAWPQTGYRRRRWLLTATILALFVALGAGKDLPTRLVPFSSTDSASESSHATTALVDATKYDADPLVVLVRTPAGVESRVARTLVGQVAHDLRRDPAVASVVTWYRAHRPNLVARNRKSTLVVAQLHALGVRGRDKAVRRLLDDIPRPNVRLGGWPVGQTEIARRVPGDMARAEAIAFPFVALLSLLFFRGLVAALLPPALAFVGIFTTFLLLDAAARVVAVNIYALNLVSALALGLALDYSLLIISRYREEAASEGYGAHALATTMTTAGRTIVISGCTVALAMGSLIFFPQGFLRSMGIAGVITSVTSVGVVVLLLPVLLLALGPRIDALAPAWLQRARSREARPVTSGAWYRLARAVLRRPLAIALVTGVGLMALGTPFLRADFVSASTDVLPTSAQSRQVADAVARDFPPSSRPTIDVLAQEEIARAGDLVRRIRQLPGVAALQQPAPVGRTAYLVRVVPRANAESPQAKRLVDRIRTLPGGHHLLVRGETAASIDQIHSLRAHLPVALLVLVLTTGFLVFALTASVVLPVKMLLMNVLTVSAAFGACTLIFQDGRLEGLLGFTSRHALEATQPIYLAAVVFALSTDYGIFLLARIKEAHDRTGDDNEAIALGMERTGRVLSSAAAIFCVAVLAPATSPLVFVKELSVGVAVGVAVDALIVRALLVPALMRLLGRANWWCPRVLRPLAARVAAGVAHD